MGTTKNWFRSGAVASGLLAIAAAGQITGKTSEPITTIFPLLVGIVGAFCCAVHGWPCQASKAAGALGYCAFVCFVVAASVVTLAMVIGLLNGSYFLYGVAVAFLAAAIVCFFLGLLIAFMLDME